MASAKDEVARRPSSRPDPRADPDSVPRMPAVDRVHGARGKAQKKKQKTDEGGLRDEVAESARRRDPRADPDSIRGARIPPPSAVPRVEEDVEVDEHDEPEEPADRPSASPEAKLAAIEPLIDRGAWKDIADKLGPPEKAAEYPPALALVYALARRESGGEEGAPGATPLAIKSMAALLDVSPDSPAALVLAKRLLRQNPTSVLARKAPSGWVSFALLAIAIVLGVAAGSFLSLEAFRSFHLF